MNDFAGKQCQGITFPGGDRKVKQELYEFIHSHNITAKMNNLKSNPIHSILGVRFKSVILGVLIQRCYTRQYEACGILWWIEVNDKKMQRLI